LNRPVAWLIALAASVATVALCAADDPPRYEFRDDHDPDGIGKFYLGREIAHVMGHQGIAWLERPEREQEERLSMLIEALHLEPGMVVADVGAGSGVISRLIAKEIGETGTVLAVDIQQEMLDALVLSARKAGLRNIQPVLGTTRSTGLKPGSVDLAILVDVYHEFDQPHEMLLDISTSLKPGGRIAFVEYRKEDPDVPIKEVHKMTQAQVRLEASQPEFGLEWLGTDNRLPWQHVVFFRRVKGEE
jgi:SAM-dependent methyltransferase